MKENLEKNLSNIQKEVPIKSANSFLYEYWNVFFYLYSKKLIEKFKKNSKDTEPNLLDSISINNLFKNDVEIKENNRDYINLNNNLSLNNPNNNSINSSSLNNIKTSLFQSKNNNIDLGNNYIYPSFNGIIQNPQNDLFMNQIPKIQNIPNNLNINTFFTGPKIIQNTYGNDIRPPMFGDIELNNINPTNVTNVPFFQIPIQNPISLASIPNTIIPSNNISNNGISNNFMINNNTNINTNINSNSNINIDKNINKFVNMNNKNLKSNNINNSSINTIPKIENKNINNKTENESNGRNIKNKEINLNENNNINKKIKFISKTYNNTINNNNSNGNITLPKNLTNSESNLLEEQIPKKSTHLFNIKEEEFSKDKDKKEGLTLKKRKRSIKNNKLVFIQLEEEKDKNEKNKEKNDSEEIEENKNESSLNSEKVSELIQKNTKPRGSRYRGVSKNGSQWQVLIMVKKKKRYLGSFSNEEEAARAYDKVALQHHGIKAKTNYDYTKEEIEEIMAGPKLLRLE